MTKDEALRLALEYVELVPDDRYSAEHIDQDALITAIKAALEAKDEPFGYFRYDLRLDAWVQSRDSNQGAAFYTTTPQRTPITDEDIRQANHHMVCGAYDYSFKQGVRWAEKVHGIKWEWEK